MAQGEKLTERGDSETKSVFWRINDPESLKYGSTNCETTYTDETAQKVKCFCRTSLLTATGTCKLIIISNFDFFLKEKEKERTT